MLIDPKSRNSSCSSSSVLTKKPVRYTVAVIVVVGLLEILQKASYAFDFSEITQVWEKKGLLHNSQYAFRAKKGTEGPLSLWSLMNDRAYLRKEDQARGQGDLAEACI